MQMSPLWFYDVGVHQPVLYRTCIHIETTNGCYRPVPSKRGGYTYSGELVNFDPEAVDHEFYEKLVSFWDYENRGEGR